MRLEGEKRAQYVAAWERWRTDVDALHKVLLDGEPLDPLHLVALLRREGKSKERYDAARVSALGLPPADDDGDAALFGGEPAGGPFGPPSEPTAGGSGR